MRVLTIKRNKSFVGCLCKIKVYIEDPASEEITIRQVPCRKLGELKNGEEKTFDVGENAARIFVIVDKASKDWCCESYQLPEGTEDVFLSGKPRFDPAIGNAFCFDQNEGNREALANRKRGSRKGVIILVLAVLVGSVAGVAISTGLRSAGQKKQKTFTCEEMSITLTNEFRENEATGDFLAVYGSKNVGVLALKEPFSILEGLETKTTGEYAELVIRGNQVNSDGSKTADGLTWFEYKNDNSPNEPIRFFAYVYKTGDAFWMVQFAVPEAKAGQYAASIAAWAKSVAFSDKAPV